jgi:hypothetical protein
MPETKEKRSKNRTIPSRSGRLWLMGIVVAFLVSAIAYLFWIGRDGGIRPDLKTNAVIELLGFYMPLLSLMAAFYFGGSQSHRSNRATPFDTFLVAVIFTMLWSLAPIFLMSDGGMEDILATLRKIKPVGDTLALAAIGYYFSKN